MKGVQAAVMLLLQPLTNFFVDIQDECEKLVATAQDYCDPQVAIEEPRIEMADVLDTIRCKMMNSFAKVLSEAVKMSAAQCNQLLIMRRLIFYWNLKIKLTFVLI
jgi:hypothetical protein